MKKLSLIILMLCAVLTCSAQPPQAAQCTSSVKMTSATQGVLTISLTPFAGWHVYGSDLPKGGPKPLQFDASTSTGIVLDGDLTPSVKPEKHYDDAFSMDVTYWAKPVTFTQKFTVTDKSNAQVSGFLRYQGCNNETCSPPKKFRFSHPVK